MNRSETGINPDQAHESEMSKDKYKRIKEEFLKPFSDDEIDSEWSVMGQKNFLYRSKLMMNRDFEGWSLKAYLADRRGRCVDFQLIDDEGNKKAEIIFEKEGSTTHWKLIHRTVETGEVGITGSEFLQQAENFMNKVSDLEYESVSKFAANSSQPTTTEWLLKNGYEFHKKDDEEKYEDYLKHPENYELINIDYKFDGKDSYKKDLFIFEKSKIDWVALGKVLNEGLSEPLGLDRPIGLKTTHPRMLRLPGLVRFTLIKKAENEFAKSK